MGWFGRSNKALFGKLVFATLLTTAASISLAPWTNPFMESDSTMGRVAVVTGGNKGIGYYVAQQLAQTGLFEVVILGCRDPGRGGHAALEISRGLSSMSDAAT